MHDEMIRRKGETNFLSLFRGSEERGKINEKKGKGSETWYNQW